MPNNLNTKIQYKTCEKGEFFDEQARSLDETLELVKNFPWDVQRGADVQLSGPGIIIKGTDGSYLKVALYFNGKFSVYYLDAENHLYEYHTPELADECQKVKEFFEGNLNLDGFDKHFFNMGNRGHFITQNFEYTGSTWSLTLSIILFGAYFSVLVGVMSYNITHASFLPGVLAFICVLIFVIIQYYRHRHTYLKLSKGHDQFFFGELPDKIIEYHKQDINEVVIYETRGSRNPGYHYHCRIFFKDGSALTIPQYVITSTRLMSKFRDDMVRVEYLSRWS